MTRWIAAQGLAAVLAVAALIGVAEARSLDDMIKAGVIRIGVNPNFPPNSSYNDKNELEGFDIDIGNKIAEALKLQGRVRADRDRRSACRSSSRTRSTSHWARSRAPPSGRS